VAACRRRSWGRRWIPTKRPAFRTIILAALSLIGKTLCSGPAPDSFTYYFSRSATFCGMKTTSDSIPLLGLGKVSFLSWISIGLIFRTSPTLIPPRAISSSMIRFLGFMVRKMISSTRSFSTIFHCWGGRSRNIFRSIAVSQGFWILASTEFLRKLKKDLQPSSPRPAILKGPQ
jgi:hypothetical protein